MKSTTFITLDMQRPNYLTVYAVQDDQLTRRVSAQLTDGGNAWTPPSGALVTIRYHKPDGTGGWYDTLEDGSSAYTINGSTVDIGLAAQCLTVPGTVLTEISFYTRSAERLSAFRFRLEVEKNVLTDAEVESSDYYNILTAQIAAVLDTAAPGPFTVFTRSGDYMVFFGDSWTVGTSGVTSRFSTRLAEKFGKTEKNFGVGGAGFCRPGNLFSSQMATALTQMTEAERNNTAYVVVVGGVNDFRWKGTDGTSTTTFANAVQAFIESCHANFPNALIVAGLCNGPEWGFPRLYQHWITAAQRLVGQNCTFPVVIVQNTAEAINGNPDNYNTDPLHPNNTGHAKLAAHLMKGIIGGGTDVDYWLGYSLNFKDGVTLSEGMEANILKKGHQFVIRPMRLSFETESGTEQLVLATLPDSNMAPAETHYFPAVFGNTIRGTVALTSSGNLIFTPTVSSSGCFTPRIEWEMDHEMTDREMNGAS